MNHEECMAGVGAVVMGATTYAWIRGHLGASEPDATWPYDLPCWVCTHRDFPPVTEGDVRFSAGEIADVHPEIVATAGERELWVVGGDDLAGQLGDVGLLDEVVVSIASVTLGAVRALFPRRYDLRLTEVDRNRAFVCARYDVVGPGGWQS